jgi:peptidoglycan/xylan/chitin deacetylase (PgdA/CDA1 family)
MSESQKPLRIVQCWDDGVVDDMRLIEILRKYGAKASFNLNYDLHCTERAGPWRFRDVKDVHRLALAELIPAYEGFTIANHTATHPFLTRIPAEDALRDIREGRDKLEQHFGVPVTGFAYPFGDTNAAVEEMVRETGHIYARTTGYTDAPCPPVNTMRFDANCHFLAPDFWERVERAKAAGDVFYFWGHSYELVTDEDWANFDAKISKLNADPDTTWTDLPTLFS